MQYGMSFTGNAAFAPEASVKETGKQLRKLVAAAHDAHLDQATTVELIRAFTSELSKPGLTDCVIRDSLVTDKSRNG